MAGVSLCFIFGHMRDAPRQETTGTIAGPDTIVPGSEQFVPAAAGLLTVLAGVGVGVGLLVRWRRRRRGERHRRPVWVTVLATTALVAGLLTFFTFPPKFFVPRFPPVGRLFPDAAFFYRTADDLPVAPSSRSWIESQQDASLVPGFGGKVVDGVVFGMPFNLIDRSTPLRRVRIAQAPQISPTGPYPVTNPAYIESMPTYGLDNHYIGLDREAGRMWELISLRQWFGLWEADAGAEWALDSLEFPTGYTTASGLPLLPMLVNYEEVAAGAVEHVSLLVGPVSRSLQWIWPARATDGRSDSPDAMPQGAWLRLRADVELSGLGRQARVVARGLQRFGAVMSDTGPVWAVRGVPDARWDDADLATLRTLFASDFEVVDARSVKIADGSMEARSIGRPTALRQTSAGREAVAEATARDARAGCGPGPKGDDVYDVGPSGFNSIWITPLPGPLDGTLGSGREPDRRDAQRIDEAAERLDLHVVASNPLEE